MVVREPLSSGQFARQQLCHGGSEIISVVFWFVCSDIPHSGGGVVLTEALPTPGRAARSKLGEGGGGGGGGGGV